MKTRRMTLAALCLALALLLPQVFHLLGMQQAGQLFLPMHIPVLIAGLILGWQYGALLGILSPLLSFALTGMPSAQRVLFMVVELMSYGAIVGLCYQTLRLKEHAFGGTLSLIIAMICGRLMYGLAISLAAILFHIDLGGFAAVWAALIMGIPGILTQLLFLPALAHVIEKGGYLHESVAVKTNTK